MESILPMQRFATQEVLVSLQKIAHVAMDSLEMIVNTFIAMELQINSQMFVLLMEIAFPQIIAIVQLLTQETIVNSQFVLDFHQIQINLVQLLFVVLAHLQIIAHVMLDTRVLNVNSIFALEFLLPIQMFAQVTEIVQIQNLVFVMLVSTDTIVTVQFFGISSVKSTL
jgi:hypothetical protein